MWEPRWDNDEAVWKAVSGKAWVRQESPLDDESGDPLEEFAARAWLLYHADPDAMARQRMRGEVKEWRDAQLKGWFSLWQLADAGWVDLLGDSVTTGRPASNLRLGDCILARAVPTPRGLSLLAASSDTLCAEEGRILAEAALSLGVLESWRDRRELVLEPRLVYEHRFECPPGRERTLKKLLQGWEWSLEDDRLLVCQVAPKYEDPWENATLLALDEVCRHLHTHWRGSEPVRRPRPDKGAVLVIDVDGKTTLHFPAGFRFRQLRRALDCLKPGVFREDSVFALSLGRLVVDEEHHELFENCLADTTLLYQALCPGSFFQLEHLPLRVLDVMDQASGPSPWFPGREDANRRLRRTFHSRLSKVRLDSDPPVEASERKLAGLERYDLGKLKPKEAMAAALLASRRPLSLQELHDILVTAGVTLVHGLQSLRKAWRRDPIIRETEDGKLELVPAALVMDSWFLGRLVDARLAARRAASPAPGEQPLDPAELERSGGLPRQHKEALGVHGLVGLLLDVEQGPRSPASLEEELARLGAPGGLDRLASRPGFQVGPTTVSDLRLPEEKTALRITFRNQLSAHEFRQEEEEAIARELEAYRGTPDTELEQYLIVWPQADAAPSWRRLPEGAVVRGTPEQLRATLRSSDVVLGVRPEAILARLGLSPEGRKLLDLSDNWKSLARETLGIVPADPLECQYRLYRYGMLHGYVLRKAARMTREVVFWNPGRHPDLWLRLTELGRTGDPFVLHLRDGEQRGPLRLECRPFRDGATTTELFLMVEPNRSLLSVPAWHVTDLEAV